jgi:hypothetical protein
LVEFIDALVEFLNALVEFLDPLVEPHHHLVQTSQDPLYPNQCGSDVLHLHLEQGQPIFHHRHSTSSQYRRPDDFVKSEEARRVPAHNGREL